MRIRAATARDAAAIARIYAPYVDGSIVTFEEVAPNAAEMAPRIESGGDLYPWLVAEEAGEIAGYASAAAFRTRTAYRFAVETSVYVRQGVERRGIGSALYRPLIGTLEAQGFTQAIAAISLPNPSSVKLHERFGFAPAGVYRQVGWKLGRWIDVGLWQRMLAAPTDPPREPRPVSGDRPAATG
ncbi:GNAT family N-acetyltransferase [Sphingomonas parva]|uniref:GNAT family N-acetyltransferase n=1 Tax=Sphingomonas parva TaxID=2555898 RepID=UPI00177E91F9|nr:GNAT family N-acetyltransferase [Sphingomonas parva]